MPDLVFPDGFLWGAATSAHQTEGGEDRSDWSQWEREGRLPRSGSACDSWNRWREDVAIAAELGLGVYRISAEWSRVQPEPGVFDEDVIARYAEILTEARRRGLQTMLVLWHFTTPQWLVEQGGWLDRSAAPAFTAYAARMAESLGGVVDYWATFNEVTTYAWQGYIKGNWPPGHKGDWFGGYRAGRVIAAAHRSARSAICDAVPGGTAPVGLTHIMMVPHRAQRGSLFSAPLLAWWDLMANKLFMNMVYEECDWIGLQYYHDSPIRTFRIALDDGDWPRTDMGWRIYPQGLYEAVMYAWRRYRKPLIITENGLADATDAQRARFIIDHLGWLHRAMDHGADVRGYLHWSLIDNFEWAHGFGPRFGLAAMDYDTGDRKIRPSARIYSEIVRSNAIPEGLGEELRYVDGTPSLAPSAYLRKAGPRDALRGRTGSGTAGARVSGARPERDTGSGR